ncbi:MAG: hypothetical protein QW638_06410 [Candidatus Bathyarchaeia archaeon]
MRRLMEEEFLHSRVIIEAIRREEFIPIEYRDHAYLEVPFLHT